MTPRSFAKGRGFDLRYRGREYRLPLSPPRGSNLKEVSGSAETPGMMDLATTATSSGVFAAFDRVDEALSYPRNLRISRIHHEMWLDLFARLKRGERPPFS
jgi:hypothetical protein